MNKVLEAYKIFLETNELGASDTKKLNLVIKKLDNENKISKEDVISLLAKNSKDQDGAYRNFVSRLETAIKTAQEEAEENKKDVLNTLKLEKIKIDNKPYIKFHGDVPKVLNTVIPNINYSEKNYIEALGTNSKLNIFMSYATKDEKDVSLFKTTLEKIANDKIITWTMNKLIHGISFDTQIKKELDKCDYGFAMLSENFLDSEYITEIEVKKLLEDNKIFPILLNGSFSTLNKLCEKDIQKQLLEKHTFSLKDRGRSDSFSAMVNDQSRENFIHEVIKALYNRKNYDLEQENIFRDNHQCYIRGRKEYDPTSYTDSYCKHQEINTSLESTINIEENLEKKIHLLEDMINWVKEENSPIYALLGEYGVGKTFNTRMFAFKLEELRKTDKNLPYPLYIDLRDTPTFIDSNGTKRQVTVEEIIIEILRLSNNKEFSAEKIIDDNKKGKAILIFDGLDEKLVHYAKDMRNKFLRELINVLDVTNFEKTNQKILISCRTHYFENIKEQNSFLRDNERFDIGKSNYHATEVLPFNMEQIKNYIQKVFPKDETEKIFTLISNDNYLKTIVTKPLMLNKLSAILPRLIEYKNSNKKITSKSFYQALIEDTFLRDNEKHTINIRDKKRLLKEVSYMFYKKGIQSISIDALNDWFNEYIYDQSTFKKYLNKDFDVLELDLRNSSLLVRYGDENFGFSHSSFYEYFIAEYLFENWESFEFNNNLSELTFEFIKETINELDSNQKNDFIKKFKNTLSKDTNENKRFQLDLLKELKIYIENIILDTQELEKYTLEDINCENLEIKNSNLFNSEIINCSIENLIITNSNLNDSYIKNCKITKIIKDEKSTMDYITDFDKLLDEKSLNIKELHNFKNNKQINIDKINIHSNFNAISNDEKYIYIGGTNSLRILDKNSFTCIKELDTSYISAISNDEKYIYIGERKSLKIFDKKTLSCIKELDTSRINAISNDEKYIYVAERKSLKIFDKNTLTCIKEKELDTSWINTISNDEKYIYTSGYHTLKIFDKNTLTCIKELYTSWIDTISNDEKYIYTGGDNSLKIFDKNTLTCIKELDTSWINAISNDEEKIYISERNSLKIFDKNNFTCIKKLDTSRITTICNDEKYIYIDGYNSLKIFDKNSFTCIKKLDTSRINAICNDEKYIYIGEYNNLKIFDKKTLTSIKEKELNTPLINAVSHDEKHIYIGEDNGLKILNKNTLTCIKELDTSSINAISNDEKYIYIAEEGSLEILNKKTFTCIKKINTSSINAISNDEKYIYIGGINGLKIFDKNTLTCIKELETSFINAISNDEKYIYIGGSNSLKIFDKNSLTSDITILLGNKKDWCSIDFRKNQVKGTEMCWKLLTVIDNNNNPFSVDNLSNFELYNYN